MMNALEDLGSHESDSVAQEEEAMDWPSVA
jgi:hypothetical protein